MEIEILKIAKTRRQLSECKDFARLPWPSGATDYLTMYTDGREGIIVGHHVDGWDYGVKRPGVQAWNLFGLDLSSLASRIIWLRIAGDDRFDPKELATEVMKPAGPLLAASMQKRRKISA